MYVPLYLWLNANGEHSPCPPTRVRTTTEGMSDPFADALDGCERDQGVEHGGGCQPSAVVVLDEDDECPAACTPPRSGGQAGSLAVAASPGSTCAPPTGEKRGQKRKGSHAAHPAQRLRTMQCAAKLALLPQQARETELMCVFVSPDESKPDACVPIPMWPQYNATCGASQCHSTSGY